jgi:alpha-beta hydrolase superfamily lysophospholipase
MKKRPWLKRTIWSLTALFAVMNVIAAVHAYRFTHFSEKAQEKSSMEDPGFWSNVALIFTGVDNPRPVNTEAADAGFQTVDPEGEIPTSCWYKTTDSAIGTVIICHGYGGCRSSMLDKADQFLKMHYNVLLPDFMGCGDSEGNQCTIGYYESAQVAACCNYLVGEGEENIVLFGTSMGAVAIMKSLSEDSLNVSAAILECPFGSMYETTGARFDMMGVPRFPMAGLLVFWGGVENGFWAFGHNPTEYAKHIKVPVLLMYGEKDQKVSRAEIDHIFGNITVPKKLVTFAQAGHENYFNQYRLPWIKAVSEFLATH